MAHFFQEMYDESRKGLHDLYESTKALKNSVEQLNSARQFWKKTTIAEETLAKLEAISNGTETEVGKLRDRMKLFAGTLQSLVEIVDESSDFYDPLQEHVNSFDTYSSELKESQEAAGAEVERLRKEVTTLVRDANMKLDQTKPQLAALLKVMSNACAVASTVLKSADQYYTLLLASGVTNVPRISADVKEFFDRFTKQSVLNKDWLKRALLENTSERQIDTPEKSVRIDPTTAETATATKTTRQATPAAKKSYLDQITRSAEKALIAEIEKGKSEPRLELERVEYVKTTAEPDCDSDDGPTQSKKARKDGQEVWSDDSSFEIPKPKRRTKRSVSSDEEDGHINKKSRKERQSTPDDKTSKKEYSTPSNITNRKKKTKTPLHRWIRNKTNTTRANVVKKECPYRPLYDIDELPAVTKKYKITTINDKKERVCVSSHKLKKPAVVQAIKEATEKPKSATVDCPICKQRVPRSNAQLHYEIHKLRSTVRFILWCNECDELFDSQVKLTKHQADNHAMYKGANYVCRSKSCDVSCFKRHQDFTEHKYWEHGELDQFRCAYCDTTMDNFQILSRHQKSGSRGSCHGKVYECRQCRKGDKGTIRKFKNRDQKILHFQSEHADSNIGIKCGEDPQCLVCPNERCRMEFVAADKLARHVAGGVCLKGDVNDENDDDEQSVETEPEISDNDEE